MKVLSKLTSKKFFLLAQILLLLFAFILRVWNFTAVPASLYSDEVSLLYDAYSLSLTGKDMHGNFLPLTTVTSFGDHKLSGYYYALVPFIKLFGPQDFVVKIPSLLAGIFIVWASGKIWRLLFNKKPWSQSGSLLLLFLTAINPSLIHVSRVGFETNLATAFLLAGIIFFLQAFKNKNKINLSLIGAEIFLLLSFYTYQSMRLFAPIFGLILFIVYCWQKRAFWKKEVLNFILVLCLAGLSLLPFLFEKQGNFTGRFTDTSIFNNLDIIIESNQCRENLFLEPLNHWFCHRYLFFSGRIIQNFFWSINPYKLFFLGDGQVRHSPHQFGFFYPFELFFLFSGLVYLLKNYQNEKKVFYFLIFWLLLATLPTSLTYDNPHLLRSLSSLPVYLIIINLGIINVLLSLKKANLRKILLGVVFVLYIIFLSKFLFYYHQIYKVNSANSWQYGYKQAIEAIKQLEIVYPDLPIYFSHDAPRFSLYYFLYQSISPLEVQKLQNEKMDQAEFMTFSPNQVFFLGFDSSQEQLAALSPTEAQRLKSEQMKNVSVINNLKGEPIFIIAKIN